MGVKYAEITGIGVPFMSVFPFLPFFAFFAPLR
jgi:hypothetical protein